MRVIVCCRNLGCWQGLASCSTMLKTVLKAALTSSACETCHIPSRAKAEFLSQAVIFVSVTVRDVLCEQGTAFRFVRRSGNRERDRGSLDGMSTRSLGKWGIILF